MEATMQYTNRNFYFAGLEVGRGFDLKPCKSHGLEKNANIIVSVLMYVNGK